MRALNTNANVDNSDLVNYPGGRIKNNTGSGNGTAVNERTKGDWHQAVEKMMRLYNIIPNNLPDNETNGFQIIDAIRALASKNDFILALSLNSGVLSIPIKLGYMLTGEQIVCKAAFDLGAETQIVGSDNVTFGFTPNGSFKTNEYVRLIKTVSGVDIVRLVDNVSLDTMVGDLFYLKKASQAQEDAGAVDTVATTPLVNLMTFVKRVVGTDSVNFLASTSRNGLLSTQQWDLIELFRKVRNIGTFSGLDINNGTIGATYPVTGNLASATLQAKPSNGSVIRIVLSNTMTNTSFYVRHFVEAQSSNIEDDGSICNLVFKPINATTFDMFIKETSSGTQNLKIHFEVVKI